MKRTTVNQANFLRIAKLILVIAIIGFVFYQLRYIYSIDSLTEKVNLIWSSKTILLLTLTCLLMPINWWLEVIKWNIIMLKHETTTNTQAWKSVITGITLSIITPNQIGDIIGKAIYLQSYSKVKGAIATISGTIAQTIVVIIIGSIGGTLLIYDQFLGNKIIFGAGSVTLMILLVLLVYVYMNIKILQNWITHTKVIEYVKILTDYTQKELGQLLLLSGLRLLVFSSQYYFLLLFFGVSISPIHAYMCISVIFLSQAFVPSFILIELGVRGAVALFFIGIYTTQNFGILEAAYSLWIINMLFPSMVGLYFLITLKWRS